MTKSDRTFKHLAFNLGVIQALALWAAAAHADASVSVFDTHAVVADHSAGAAAGAAVLALGGNAADATAAALLALGVVHPASSGLGGGGYALVYQAKERTVHVIDFRETAPGAASPTMYSSSNTPTASGPLSEPSQYGGLAVAVPGEPAGIEHLLKRFGRLDRRAVVAPALYLAESGFRVSSHLSGLSRTFASHLKADPGMATWFSDDQPGLLTHQVLKRPKLAKTLRTFAKSGARPFYRGAIARNIVKRVRDSGGILSAADLRNYRVIERPPLQAVHFGYRWVTVPPSSSGGLVLLETLGLLEHWVDDAQTQRRDHVLHAMAEAFKGAFWDRARFVGDPDFVQVPLAQLLSPDRTAYRAGFFHPTLAASTSSYALPVFGYREPSTRLPEGDGTANVCVIDREGNAVVATTTVNLPFGARISTDGIVLNDQMDDFAKPESKGQAGTSGADDKANAESKPGEAQARETTIDNLPRPGRRPLSTLTPTMVFDARGLTLAIGGSSGGTRIVTATAQVAFETLVAGRDPAVAVTQPRIHHQGVPDVLRHEVFAPLPELTLSALKARGHRMEPINFAAAIQMIRVGEHRGRPFYIAVTDPRKPALPAGR